MSAPLLDISAITLRFGGVTALSNGGAPSTLGQSSSAPANILLDGGVLQYAGGGPGSTDRGFTLNANGGGFDASGTAAAATFNLTTSNTIAINPGLGNVALVLTGTGNATAGTGIANVLYEILSPQTAVKIMTTPIPEPLVGKTYGEIKRAWTGYFGSSLVLGVLENTGNSDSVRNRALRNAQKTPNMSELVGNLKRVKSLKFNHPVFAPPNDYVVTEGSLAIVLDNRAEGDAQNEHSEKTA